MFKKNVKIGAQNQLSGKDRKALKNKMNALFNEECVEKMLAVNEKIVCCKVGGSKMLIYNGNQYPLVVDGTGKGDYFPSLYTCQAYQTITKSIIINQGVEAYIFNGANLMWPGVYDHSALGEFKKDDVISVRSIKGEIIAIGAMGCSAQEFAKNAEKNGIAVHILHFKQDKLWELGPKTIPEVIIQAKVIIPEKMKEQEVVENPTEEQKPKNKKEQEKGKTKKEKGEKKREATPEKEESDHEDEAVEDDDDDDDQADFMALVHSKKQKKPEIKMEKKKVDIKFEEEDDRKGKKKKPTGKDKKKKKQQKQQKMQEMQEQKMPEETEAKSVISSKLMDQYLKESFLNALKLSKVEGELPIDSGRFYIDYMLLARPEGVKLQVKDSSYKKLGKFYEQMGKLKIIQFKHPKDKKGQQGSTINKIFWDNQELRNYEPTVLRLQQKDIQAKEDLADSKKKLTLTKTLAIVNVYKPSEALKAVLWKKKVNFIPTQQQQEQMKEQQQQERNRPIYFPEAEIKAQIEKYIDEIVEGKSKQKKVERMVMIKYTDNKFIQELLEREIEEFEENQALDQMEQNSDEEKQKKGKKQKKKTMFRIDRNLLINKMLKKCSMGYRMMDKDNEIDLFKQGAFKGIQIIAEKANNKNITKVIGLQTFIIPKKEADEQIYGFANMLQQKFACSVNVQNLPGRHAGKQIIVHGAFPDQLQEIFTLEHHIKKDYITIQNKLDKKKKH